MQVNYIILGVFYNYILVTLPGQFMFEGAKSEITSRVTPKFHVNHSFTLAPVNPFQPGGSIYSFSAGLEGDQVRKISLFRDDG